MTTMTMTGLEKVALLLKRLPPEVADKVMRHLDSRQASLVLSQIKKLSDRGELDQSLAGVVEEAVQMLKNDTRQKHERPAAAKLPESRPSLVASARSGVDIRVGDKPEDKSAAGPAELKAEATSNALQALAALAPELLAGALNNESARTCSLLMNQLNIEFASQIYKRLLPAKRREVSLRFTDQTTVAVELVERIAQGVLKKCETLTAAPPPPAPVEGERPKRMAALLRELERTERMELLTVLEQTDAVLTKQIKALLYEFEDILRMENASVQKWLSEVDVKSLAQALRGAAQDIEDKILANLSKRAQESLKEEISLSGPVPAAKVRQARQTLLDAMQRLDQRGELVFVE